MAKKYIGPGFVFGVPARDLTDDDWKALTKDERDRITKSGAYEDADAPKDKDAPKEKK